MKYGIIHAQVNAFNPEMKHLGLDIAVAPKASNKSFTKLELEDFELLNLGHVIPNQEFSASAVAELYDKVIFKYFEQPKLEQVKEQIEEESKKTVELPIKGKFIKAIRKTGEEHEIITYDESQATPEVNKLVNEILRVKGIADIKIKEQMLYCANKLRVGTLDMKKDGTRELHVHVEGGTQPISGKIPRKQVIATLWFVTRMYMQAPSYRKYLSVDVQDGKYKCGYKNSIPYFETQGLSQLEIDIINDLKLIKEE